MNKLTPEYLAGLIDGEGTFQIQVQIKKNGSFTINPRIQFGFKADPEESELIESVCEYLNYGKKYLSNVGRENAMVRYCTTKFEDGIALAKLIQPHLHLKKRQCELFLQVCEICLSTKHRRYIKGYKTTTRDIYTKEQVIEIIRISTTINASRQTGKYRDGLSRNADYYIAEIDKIYAETI